MAQMPDTRKVIQELSEDIARQVRPDQAVPNPAQKQRDEYNQTLSGENRGKKIGPNIGRPGREELRQQREKGATTRALINSVQARLNDLDRAIEHTENELQNALKARQETQAQLDNIEQQMDRAARAREEVSGAQQDMSSAQATLGAQRAALADAQNAGNPAAIAQAQQGIDQAQALIDEAQLKIDESEQEIAQTTRQLGLEGHSPEDVRAYLEGRLEDQNHDCEVLAEKLQGLVDDREALVEQSNALQDTVDRDTSAIDAAQNAINEGDLDKANEAIGNFELTREQLDGLKNMGNKVLSAMEGTFLGDIAQRLSGRAMTGEGSWSEELSSFIDNQASEQTGILSEGLASSGVLGDEASPPPALEPNTVDGLIAENLNLIAAKVSDLARWSSTPPTEADLKTILENTPGAATLIAHMPKVIEALDRMPDRDQLQIQPSNALALNNNSPRDGMPAARTGSSLSAMGAFTKAAAAPDPSTPAPSPQSSPAAPDQPQLAAAEPDEQASNVPSTAVPAMLPQTALT